VAEGSPRAAFELLGGLSLLARYAERAVSAEQVDRVVEACRSASGRAGAAEAERLLAQTPRAAWPIVCVRLIEALAHPETTPVTRGTRDAYLRIVESDEASAAAAAVRCGELLRDPSFRRLAVCALSPSIVDRLDPADRMVIPAVLALELQDGWLDGERVVRGWAALEAAPLLWDDFLPAARAQVVERSASACRTARPSCRPAWPASSAAWRRCWSGVRPRI